MASSHLGQSIDLQSIIDAQDNAFVVIDKDYNIVAANKTYCTAYGISNTQIVGRKCHKVSHHSDVPCHLNGEDCPHKEVFETEQPFQVLHIHFDANDQEEHVRIKGSPIRSITGELFLGEAIYPLAKQQESGLSEQRMLGTSPAFLACVEEMAGAAKSNVPILLNGESGAGKQLAATFIHKSSARKAKPFVSIDCASISEGSFESELFGHERGAFTGCIGRRDGLIESAEGGTLFMDEISEVPLHLQGRLLRALDTGYYRRLGGRDDLHVNVRVICATHNNLRKMVEQGSFRADLYYRIAGMSITVPPLRERRQDIETLARFITENHRSQDGNSGRIAEDAIELLKHYDYPGNVRELKNILQQAMSMSSDGLVTPHLLKFDKIASDHIVNTAVPGQANEAAARSNHTDPTTNRSISEIEANHIESLLHQYNGHRARVAEVLKISERTLYRKLKQYNLAHVGKHRGASNG